MTDIEVGTLVHHPSNERPMPWLGPSDHSGTTLVISAKGSGLKAPMDAVVPATVPIPDKSSRITASKAPTTLHYGPKLTWFGYLDGEVVARNKDTKREATRVALVTMVVRDFHKES